MANEIKNSVQNYNHLKYYQNTTIDAQVWHLIQSLALPVDVSIEYFLYRLNFYLEITDQKLCVSQYNNKESSQTILSDFYAFCFNENNRFLDSNSNRNRYNKIFIQLEKFLNIEINRNAYFNWDNINQEKLTYFSGWFVSDKKRNIFINFIEFYHIHGSKKAREYFTRIEQYVKVKGFFAIKNSIPLINKSLNYLAQKQSLLLSHSDLIVLMQEFFTEHQEKNNQIEYRKQEWNQFIWLSQSLFEISNHEQYLLSKKENYNTHIKIKNGKQYKAKLITEIPLEICDNDAFDILFKKINQDIDLVNDWATQTIEYHYKKFLEVKDDLEVKSHYYNKTVKEIAMLKFGKYDRINQIHLYDKDAYLNKNVLFAICAKLVIHHPQITDGFINSCLYLDSNDKAIGLNSTDQGTQLISYKNRRGANLAEQKILLNKESSRLISILLEMSEGIRENLKNANDDRYRYLFIAASVNNLEITDSLTTSFKIDREPYNNIISFFQNEKGIALDDSMKIANNISLTKIRASRGVQIYFETQSTTQMAKALGHVKYDPKLLSRYLPEPILEFFQRRWILLFQKGIICEAMKNSQFLLKASNFKTIEQLNEFLKNHTLKNIPDIQRQESQIESSDSKIYISIDEEKVATLLSIGRAIENAKDLTKISSKAIYWKQLGEEIVKEINSNRVYAQYRNVIEKAQKKIAPELFDKVIYE